MVSKKNQKEIDWNIMTDNLHNSGWIKVQISFVTLKHSRDVQNWLIENCKFRFYRIVGGYLFEDKSDAEWFTLRWS